MKIAIVCPYNIFKPGGVQQHVSEHSRILRERGHTVDIITPKPYQLPPDAHKLEGVVFIGGSARIRAPHATHSDISISVDNDAIEAVLDDGGYDIVHVHEPLVPVLARQILSRSKCLRVGTFHAAMPGNVLGKSLARSYKAYARSVLPHVDVITAVSPAAIGYIEDYLDDKTVINFIPNGINLDNYKKSDLKRDKNMILFLGRLEKRKGALYAIKAFEVLSRSNPKLKLVIAGDGPLKESIQDYVEDNAIKNIEFLGYVDEKLKHKLLSRCGVFTSPALYGESFGIVLAEAMALGAPIVANGNAGYKCVLKKTGRISLVDVKDTDAYAERLALMLEDDAIRSLWQQWAEDYVRQFDYERVVDAYEKLYKTHINKA